MATTLTTVNLDGQPFPFIGLPTPPSQQPTAIPSAEIHFFIKGVTVTAAAAGEDQALIVNCSLPRSFCYVLVDAAFRLTGIDVDAWDLEALCSLQDGALAPDVLVPIVMKNTAVGHVAAASFARAYVIEHPPQLVLVPRSEEDARFSIQVHNVVIDDAVAVLQFYARFLRYDRNQVQNWQVNTPVLVR